MKPSVLVFALLSGILAVYAAMSYKRVTAPPEQPAVAGSVGRTTAHGSHGASKDLAAAPAARMGDPTVVQDPEDKDDDDDKDEPAAANISTKPALPQLQAKTAPQPPARPPVKFTLSEPVNTTDPSYVPILVQAYGGAATAKLQSIITGDYDRSLRLQAVDGLAQILKTGGAGTVPVPVVVGTDPSNTGGSPDDSGDNSGGGNGGPGGGTPPVLPANVPLTVLHDVATGDPNPAVRQEAWKQLVDLQNNSQGKVTLYKEALVSENGKLSSGSSAIKRWAKIELKAVGVLR